MRAGIALGSNLGDRLTVLKQARARLLTLPGICGPERTSSIYETDPVSSDPSARAFLNAVIEIDFDEPAITLLDRLQTVESALGRPSKRPRNAPRIIDLDILYVGNLVLANAEVVIPHPRLHLRRFVLQPLAEIRPELILPGQELTVAAMLEALPEIPSAKLYAETWDV